MLTIGGETVELMGCWSHRRRKEKGTIQMAKSGGKVVVDRPCGGEGGGNQRRCRNVKTIVGSTWASEACRWRERWRVYDHLDPRQPQMSRRRWNWCLNNCRRQNWSVDEDLVPERPIEMLSPPPLLPRYLCGGSGVALEWCDG